MEFQQLRALLESEVPNLQSTLSVGWKSLREWAGTDYEDAIEVHALAWSDDQRSFELICSLTVEAGRIDLVVDGDMTYR